MIGYMGDMRRKKKAIPPQKKISFFKQKLYVCVCRIETCFAALIYFNVQKNSKQPHFAKIWQILAKHDNIFAAKWTSKQVTPTQKLLPLKI